jgi:hypothetical protein
MAEVPCRQATVTKSLSAYWSESEPLSSYVETPFRRDVIRPLVPPLVVAA